MTASVQPPGDILAQRLEAIGVSPTELARQLCVPANRITQIINGKRGITGDSALRLAHWFGDTPQFWMSLQVQSDLQLAEAESGQAIRALPTGPTVRRHKAYRQVKNRIGKDL
ncbi:TPA: HigA family addiction module antitoxin [Pseudomonas aeruginosa]|uniref:HigA family addiction module antitoxin n=1 Tax=Pseudomonas aeruginosa TaxID=287 RepID=UPI0009A3610F|nr:HigA family addiction module antidote protein [Pseudomonas aeruginosa]EKY0498006.1 HigA family addiction module antidote protein [Pseudomonas aeruginosa]EKY1844847.1 HigA family addiction module antidote protein [Pseudomonas aeruginosa]ELN4430185.1 HigA family addiction module antidote protein [Pseudomonas aeruginosa]ELO0720209.1 HigA family addiction module antidote protein [Pseudomonas aeruginosa]